MSLYPVSSISLVIADYDSDEIDLNDTKTYRIFRSQWEDWDQKRAQRFQRKDTKL